MTIVKKFGIKSLRLSDPIQAFEDYCKSVTTGMTNNVETFPLPPVPIKQIEEKVKALGDANVAEGDRSANTRSQVKKIKGEIIEVLSTNANYVLLVANGDRSIAVLSGYTLTEGERKPQPPKEFKAVFVGVGPDPGTAIVNIEERAGNALFIVQQKVEDKWVMIDAFGELTFTVEGLPPGQSMLRIYGKKSKKKSPAVELVVRAS